MEPTKNPQTAGCNLEASNVVGRYTEASSTTPPPPATIIDRHVVIGKGENGLFMVTVQPPLEGHEPQIFDSHKKARGHACGLRLVNRWAIHDETGDGK